MYIAYAAFGRQMQHTSCYLFFLLISGTIPKSMGTLERLKILNLSSNNLSGSIPESLGKLTQLESLGVFENALEGSIPASLGNLENLKELVLANNRLGGAIPYEFGQLASLRIFQIQNNQFNSFKNIEQMNTKQFLVFDYDGGNINTKFKDVDFSRTRMADTKFEDVENED